MPIIVSENVADFFRQRFFEIWVTTASFNDCVSRIASWAAKSGCQFKAANCASFDVHNCLLLVLFLKEAFTYVKCFFIGSFGRT
jgi:hypothetical protein